MTKPWGLEVDRVELVIGSLLQAPEEGPQGPFILPPSVPGLEGIAGPIQQLAMHFFNQNPSQPKLGLFKVTFSFLSNWEHSKLKILTQNSCISEDTVTVTDELTPGTSPHSVEELLSAVRLLLSETLVSRVGACFQFYIISADQQQQSYYVDLRQGQLFLCLIATLMLCI